MNRTKIIILSILANAIIYTSASHAQLLEVGVRLFPTFSNMTLRNSDASLADSESGMGFGGGLILGFHFNEHVGVQGEINYWSVIQKYSAATLQHKIILNYVSMPLLLVLNTDKSRLFNIHLTVGPQISLKRKNSIITDGHYEAGTRIPYLSPDKTDLSFAYGAGIDAAVNKARTFMVTAGYRGNAGLSDISSIDHKPATNTYSPLYQAHLKTGILYAGFSFLL